MLELIFDNIIYDAGMTYFGLGANMQQLVYTLSFCVVQQGSGNFASWYATHEPGSSAQIESFVDMALELE